MQHLILLDKEAITAPTSKMIKRDEFIKIRPNAMPRQMAFIFKPKKPIAIERDLAVFLMEKYKGKFEIVETVYKKEKPKSKVMPKTVKNTEPEIKEVPQDAKSSKYDGVKYADLVQIAKKRGIKSWGIKRPALIKMLVEDDLKVK